MSRVSRTLAASLTAVVLIGAAACGDGTSPDTEATGANAPPIEGLPDGMKVYAGLVRFDESIGNLMLLVNEGQDQDPATRPVTH